MSVPFVPDTFNSRNFFIDICKLILVYYLPTAIAVLSLSYQSVTFVKETLIPWIFLSAKESPEEIIT